MLYFVGHARLWSHPLLTRQVSGFDALILDMANLENAPQITDIRNRILAYAHDFIIYENKHYLHLIYSFKCI
jgi:hypothetical protein